MYVNNEADSNSKNIDECSFLNIKFIVFPLQKLFTVQKFEDKKKNILSNVKPKVKQTV